MKANRYDELLKNIGTLLAMDENYPIDGTLLYADVETDAVAASIFKDRGNHILYRRDGVRFCDPLLDLWEETDPNRRWAEIEYLIRDGKFEVTYTYPDQIDPKEEPLDRRDRIVRRHFGDKPIVYPPWDDEETQQFDL